MRRGPPRSWHELGVGAAALLVIAVLVVVIFFTDEVRRAIAEGPEIRVTAPRTGGLDLGSPVWIAGTVAGRVTSIRFADPDVGRGPRVRIRAVLDRGVAELLRADARARIIASALLAPAVLSIDPGSPALPPLDPHDTIRIDPSPTPEELLAGAARLRPALDSLAALQGELARRLREGGGTVARLRDDPALLIRLEAGIRGLAELLRDGSRGTLARLAADTAARAAGMRAVARLRALAANDAATASAAGAGIAAEGAIGGADVGPAVEAPGRIGAAEAAAALARVARRLRAIREDLAAGRGTAGRALYDEELRRRVEALRRQLDSTRAALLEDPLEWLRVRPF